LNDLLVGQPTKKTTKSKGKPQKPKKPPLFVWGEDQQKAFEMLKSCLTNTPVLGYADYTKPFLLHTDASLQGLGAVLYQRQGDVDRVIAYASRSLRKSEKAYPVHKLEFLALKWSVTEKFHDYLYGGKFKVVTDNNPLTYVNTTAKLDAMSHRWLASLSNYDFNVTYRKGATHADADGLSRCLAPEVVKAIQYAVSVEATPLIDRVKSPDMPHPVPQPSIPEHLIKAVGLSSKDWHSAQVGDPNIYKILTHLQNGTKPAPPLDRHLSYYCREWSNFVVLHGVVYRRAMIDDTERLQLLLPEKLRLDVFNALHDDLGHQGRDRTISLFKERCSWVVWTGSSPTKSGSARGASDAKLSPTLPSCSLLHLRRLWMLSA